MGGENLTSEAVQIHIAAERLFPPGRLRELFRNFLLHSTGRIAGIDIDGCRVFLEIYAEKELTRQVCVGRASDGDDFLVTTEIELGRFADDALLKLLPELLAETEYPYCIPVLRDGMLSLRSARRGQTLADERELGLMIFRPVRIAGRIEKVLRRSA